jgi:hypothetical protein
MVVELVRSRSKEPKVNQDLVSMLREVLRMAEAGELQAAAIAYVQAESPVICYEADGYEAVIACAARQVEEDMRSVIFDDADMA